MNLPFMKDMQEPVGTQGCVPTGVSLTTSLQASCRTVHDADSAWHMGTHDQAYVRCDLQHLEAVKAKFFTYVVNFPCRRRSMCLVKFWIA